MDTNYKQALTEVLEILNHSDKSITEKIPQNFIDFLYENMDKDYVCNIDFSNENWDDNVKEETQSIIALIYRDYICSSEERKTLLAEEVAEREKQERELREKYNPDNVFKKKISEIPEELENQTSLIEIKKTPWYKKIYEKILKIFGIKH